MCEKEPDKVLAVNQSINPRQSILKGLERDFPRTKKPLAPQRVALSGDFVHYLYSS